MNDALKVFLLVLSALFPIVDPLAGGPVFLALTRDYSPETRMALSWRVALHSLLLMTASYFIGSNVLNFFGVSLPVVQVAGGSVVVSVGWAMLKAKEEDHHVSRRTVESSEIYGSAFYPLTVGPGSISVAVTLGANSTHRYGFHIPTILAAVIAMSLIALSIFLCYAFAARLARVLGKTAMTVIIRLTSFLLVCIGVQIVWNGLSGLLSSLRLR
jgi:multiple antibiotic resistance protein